MGIELIRVAGVLLYTGDRVLMQHRDDKPDIIWPDHWAIFGGHLEPGEDAETGARREILEELGLELRGPLEPVYEGSDHQRHRTFFAVPLEARAEDLTLTEGQGMELLSAAELRERKVVPLHREIAIRLLGRLDQEAPSSR